MSYVEQIVPEFEQEMASTRKVLERVPDDKLDWKPHAKMKSIGWNANHLAEIPDWIAGVVLQDSWDAAPLGGEPYKSPNFRSAQEILAYFDKNVASGREALGSIRDEAMLNQNWSLLQGGNVLFTMPRWMVIRSFGLNHLIHHRAHLIVSLRLNDIPVPGMYGPGGDDAP